MSRQGLTESYIPIKGDEPGNFLQPPNSVLQPISDTRLSAGFWFFKQIIYNDIISAIIDPRHAF